MNNKISIGGQAVIEGVMMRSKDYIVTSVWKGKRIVSKKEHIKPKNWFFRLFIIRGIVNLIEMLYYGIKTLIWSANQFESKKQKLSNKEIAISIVTAVFLAVILFIVLPLYLTKIIIKDNGIIFNLIDGGLRILIFLLYLISISFIADLRRLFEFHGAEHKVVNCYESGQRLTIGNIRRQSTIHPRCGTSFIIIVLIISILIFSMIITDRFYQKLLLRITLLPLIAGISYEALKLSSRFKDNLLVRLLISPGLLLQRITTRNPDKKQIIVALNSLNKVLELGKN